MENALADNILRVCQVLKKHNVQFMLVGGTAVALHGYFRPSEISPGVLAEKPDVDIWYNPTYQHYFNLLNALEELGQDVQAFRDEKTPNPRQSFFKYRFDNFTLDFLPRIKAPLKFKTAYERRQLVTINNVDIVFISYHDLIADKQIDPRKKDIRDIQELQLRRKPDK